MSCGSDQSFVELRSIYIVITLCLTAKIRFQNDSGKHGVIYHALVTAVRNLSIRKFAWLKKHFELQSLKTSLRISFQKLDVQIPPGRSCNPSISLHEHHLGQPP